MIVKQSILTTLLLSAHSNAKDGAKFRDVKAIPASFKNGPARKLRGGADLQTVGFGGVGLGLARATEPKNEEENSSSTSSLVHDDPESSGRYDDYDSESLLKAMDEDFQEYHELLLDSNDSTLVTGGVAKESDAVGKDEQDVAAMFGGGNKKKSASASSSLLAEELLGSEFVKEMLGDALDAGSNKFMSEGHGDNLSANAATSS